MTDINIHIQIPHKTLFNIQINTNTTLIGLKNKLQNMLVEESYNIDRFIFNGKQLNMDKTIEYYNIHNGDNLYLVPVILG